MISPPRFSTSCSETYFSSAFATVPSPSSAPKNPERAENREICEVRRPWKNRTWIINYYRRISMNIYEIWRRDSVIVIDLSSLVGSPSGRFNNGTMVFFNKSNILFDRKYETKLKHRVIIDIESKHRDIQCRWTKNQTLQSYRHVPSKAPHPKISMLNKTLYSFLCVQGLIFLSTAPKRTAQR